MSNKIQINSFIKRENELCFPTVAGTKHSTKNGQLICSSGIALLDTILGGGLPLGSILLIEEDLQGVYSEVIMKLFLAEGIVNNHHLYVASLSTDPKEILHNLPAVDAIKSKKEEDISKDEMKIAWRYQNQSYPHPESETQNFSFDLAKKIDKNMIDKCTASMWDGLNLDTNKSSLYNSLLHSLKDELLKSSFLNNKKSNSNLSRIVIHSLASPLWSLSLSNEGVQLTQFLLQLRCLLKSSSCVGLITIPSYLYNDSHIVKRILSLVDFSISLESFQGSEKETNPIFKDYHGLLHINKLSASCSLVPPIADADEWVFCLKKRKFIIEKLHLPPELSETANRDQADSSKGQFACTGSKLPSKLEF